jgi:hypothetical protein
MAPGQSRADIVRRSAGLPAALTALFLAEPGGQPRSLLPAGMEVLLGVALRGGGAAAAAAAGGGGQGPAATAGAAAASGDIGFVVEDAEEPWPRVSDTGHDTGCDTGVI